MQRRRVYAAVIAVSFIGLVTAPGGASADNSARRGPPVKVLLDGLTGPKGLAFNQFRNLIVSSGAYSDPSDPSSPPPSPVVEYVLRGPARGTVNAVSGPADLVDVAISPVDGTGWGIGGGFLFHQLADGTVVQVLDITAYQAGDPDPTDQDQPPFPEESNPYGLVIAWNGDALITDAANNDLIRVSPDGTARTAARFDVEMVKTDHLPDIPDFAGLPDEIPAEAVPTTVALGPDGYIYVGELKGFPFRPGTSNVWRIKPGVENALCSVNTPDPNCTLYSSGFTAIQDIAFHWATGKMYVYELAEAGVLAYEAGFETGQFPPAVLLEVKRRWHDDDANRRGEGHHDKGREIATGQLSQPGGIVVDWNGQIYVTDGMFTGGRLLRVPK